MLGLKRGEVALFPHQKEWETEAQNTICRLKEVLGDIIVDIAHVGSTSIPTIKAKPIIDIAVAVENFDSVLAFENDLREQGFYYRPDIHDWQLLFASGSYYDGTGDLQTHFIHVVKAGSTEWINYINFRDYLIANPDVVREYESLKESIASHPDINREKYTASKHSFIVEVLRKASVK
ncbi:MAG: GrpB family protein [Clostridia bacterium]|nr:GrpB family protein [Clostridia bacterium]